ncbi:MAG TPA: hypothetical protein DCG14_02855 [Phycisphaerales bacterium]|nr:hypothetical protein [Phycisphaerales bacterium]
MRHRLALTASVLIAPIVSIGGAASGQQFQDQTSDRFPTQALYSNQLSFCDIDLDGDLDIAFADGQGYSSQGSALRARIYINDGNGVFTDESEARVPIIGWYRGVEFGDVDRDGDWDMVLANDFYKTPVLLINDGNGFFSYDFDRLPPARLSSARAQFADVDDDDDLDLFFCNSGTSSRFGSNGRPVLYLNDGTGFFTDATAERTPNSIIRDQQDCHFFDADGDLDLDLHIGSRSTNNGGSQLWFNDGAGNFTRLQSGIPTDGSCYSYDTGDCNGDGNLDLLGANSGSSNRELLLLNDGTGTNWTDISNRISPNPTSDDNDTKFIDYDMDGDLDFVVAALFSSQDRFYRNDGSGFFTQQTNMMSPITDASLDVGFADVDGDGRPDMVTAQGEGGNFQNRLYMNTGPVDELDPEVRRTSVVAPAKGELGPFPVRTAVFDQYTSDRGFYPRSIELVYTVDGGRETVIEMDWSGNSVWRGEIPAVDPCSLVTYFVRAEDRAGNVGVGVTVDFETTGTCGSIADLNGDGLVNGADVGLLLAQWGGPGTADFNGSGTVNGADLGIMLVEWTG